MTQANFLVEFELAMELKLVRRNRDVKRDEELEQPNESKLIIIITTTTLQLSLKEMGERIAQRPKPVKNVVVKVEEFLPDEFFSFMK